jgi:hypothetical protein
MPYKRDTAIQFWSEFDEVFNFDVSTEVANAYAIIRGYDYIRTRWNEHRQVGTYPDGFLADVTLLREGVLFIAQKQLAIMDLHLGGDAEAMQRSFEDFGQGVLFDDRREPGSKVHMMDTSGLANPPIGYHRWHTIVRATIMLGIDTERWTEIDRYVALAWAIQSEAKPVQDTENPGLSEERLQAFRETWLGRDLDEIDAAFDIFPYPP